MTEPRCEICQTADDLLCCTQDGQPMLWFCREHMHEHMLAAHHATEYLVVEKLSVKPTSPDPGAEFRTGTEKR